MVKACIQIDGKIPKSFKSRQNLFNAISETPDFKIETHKDDTVKIYLGVTILVFK